MPVSLTSIYSAPLENLTDTVIPPLNVNLVAFPIKLNNICFNLFWSDLIVFGTDKSTIVLR